MINTRYDLSSPAYFANPQAVYSQMRDQDPIYLHTTDNEVTGKKRWILTRYADTNAVLRHKSFGREFRKLQAEFGLPVMATNPVGHWMLHRDPPDHTRLRALVHRAFTPRMVENLRPRIRTISDELLTAMEGNDKADLLAAFAIPLPVIVIAELLGIPSEERQQFRDWSVVFTGQSTEEEFYKAVGEFIAYMDEQINDRRANPKDDLISALVAAEDDGDTLSHEELLSMIQLLLIAGHETTVNLIGNGTLSLMQHPDQMQKLVKQPDLVKTAIEEMLRYNGPIDILFPRYALEDVEINGQVYEKGDVVMMPLLAANRDPEVFDDPETFDITRQDNKHMAFGNGIHYCVGAPLARLEAEIAFNALLARFPNITLDTDPAKLEWNPSTILHGLHALPVKLT